MQEIFQTRTILVVFILKKFLQVNSLVPELAVFKLYNEVKCIHIIFFVTFDDTALEHKRTHLCTCS